MVLVQGDDIGDRSLYYSDFLLAPLLLLIQNLAMRMNDLARQQESWTTLLKQFHIFIVCK